MSTLPRLTLAPARPRRPLPSSAAASVPPGTVDHPADPARPGAIDHRALRRRVISAVLLIVAAGTVLLAVPALRPVGREIEDMNPALVLGAVALEIASCVSFVVIFRQFFDTLPTRFAHGLAWTQSGSGALLPGGGVGALAVGGWLLHLVGMPTRQIVRRSSGLFFLTSAINVITLAGAGIVLLLGIGAGPHDLLRAGLPTAAALGAAVLALGLPRLAGRVAPGHPSARWLADIGVGVPAARGALLRPSWRLLGGLGYLLFDIAVLWTTLAAVGPAPAVAPLLVAYLVGYLANSLPVPGGLGVLDAGLGGALVAYGQPVTHAAAAVLVYHAVAFWIPALGGILAYADLRRGLTHGSAISVDTPGRSPARSSAVSVVRRARR